MKLLNFFIDKSRIPVTLVLCLALFNSLVNAQTTTHQSPNGAKTYSKQQIQQKAVGYIEALFPPPDIGELSYQAVPLDRRIKIKPCYSDLHLSIPGNAELKRQTTVLVRCNDSNKSRTVNGLTTKLKSWSLYVQVKISKRIPVVVARVNLPPGTVISADKVMVMLKDSYQIRGKTLQQTNLLIGAKTSRHIRAGESVTLRQICLVCEGDPVTVIAKIKGLQVKTSGIAQQNGSLGDNIAILNNRSNKRIDARVVAVNRVEINI